MLDPCCCICHGRHEGECRSTPMKPITQSDFKITYIFIYYYTINIKHLLLFTFDHRDSAYDSLGEKPSYC